MNIFIVSLGCPKNLVDTEVMTGELLVKGFGFTMDPEEADIYLINTCAFIESARQDAVDAIEEAADWKNADPENRMLVVTGCLVQWDKEGKVKREWPEVDLWTGIDMIPQIPEQLLEVRNNPKLRGLTRREEVPCYLYSDATPRFQWTLPHLAYLKIGEGCNNRCTYCSIPGIRGELRSRDIPSIRQEAVNLIAGGVKELVIIAQDITAFGHDGKQGDFGALLRELQGIEGDFKIRLLYAHPAHLTDEMIDAMAECDKVLPYLDLPLQHISDRLLKMMGRKTTRARIESILEQLRRKIPGIAIRTTFITGFPGETEADYEELKSFIKEQKFDRLGVFAYCPEENTPAFTMAEQVPEAVAEQRADGLMKIQGKIALELNKKLAGRVFRVIIDEVGKKFAVGRTYMDAPDVDNTVRISPPDGLRAGDVADIRITGVSKYDLFGEVQKKGKKLKL
jgi:ribosomal protein S12 methylthiotransferase